MFYGLIKAVLTPVLRTLFRVRTSGMENIPETGAVILASNHQAFCDSLFLPMVVRRRVTFVAKAEYFSSWKTRWFFRAIGQIPMNREGGDAAKRSLGEALALLQAGGCLGIYPEGTRPPDERLHRGRTGVARLALAANCPIVPVGIKGTRAVQPIGARMLRPFKTVELVFGEPLDLTARYGARLDEPLVLRQATDELMWDIRQLSGQEYVDRYASRRAQAAADEEVRRSAAGGESGSELSPIASIAPERRVLADSA
ncbi:MAG: lysophospholipid acyltransferase family protein [Acidimicrobiales bacterium]